MANLALSTQIPQIGDSSQQLLARMAAAAADQVQNLSLVTAFPYANRTATVSLDLPNAPQGVNGIRIFLGISVSPGVDTLTLSVYDAYTRNYVASSGPTTGNSAQVLINQFGVSQFSWSSGYTFATKVAWSDKLGIDVVHSGVGVWNYTVNYKWLKL